MLRPRRILLTLGALCLFVLVWLAIDRAGHARRAVRVVEDPAVPAPAGGDRLRVGAYNIAHGRGHAADTTNFVSAATRRAALEDVGRWLRQQDLELVVLNEVDLDAVWSHGENQAALLARAAGYRWRVEQRNLDVGALGLALRTGNAILSRYPVKGCRYLDYPAYRAWEALAAGKKGGVVCDVETPAGEVRLVAVHLSHRSEVLRMASAALLTELCAESARPIIAAGDFNTALPGGARVRAVEGETALSRLVAACFRTPTPVDEARWLSFPSTAPDRVLDWILVTSPLRFERYVVGGAGASDHLPVVAELSFGDDDER